MTPVAAPSGQIVRGRLTLSDGVRLELLDSGRASPHHAAATPLVLLHGFTGSAATWEELLPSLAAHRRVVAISLAGHGASDAPADAARYAAARAAADVVQVLDALALPRVALLGYSMGGRVALHVALAAPRRVRALLLESASPGIADPESRAARRESDRALAHDIELDGVAAFVARWERLPLWESQRALPEAVRARLRALRLAGDARGLANSLRGLGQGESEPLHGRLPELRMPVLLLSGALDEAYVAIAREMAAAMPRASVAVTAGAGHAVHLERPSEFGGAVNAFLDGLDGPSAGRHAGAGTGATEHAHAGAMSCDGNVDEHHRERGANDR